MERRLDLESLTEVEFPYQDIPLENLLLYGALKIKQQDKIIDNQNLTVVALKLFPEVFSLPLYPEYPDSFKVASILKENFKNFSLLKIPNARTGYILSDIGLIKLIELEEIWGTSILGLTIKYDLKTKIKSTLQEIKESLIFKDWESKRYLSINKTDFCQLLKINNKSTMSLQQQRFTIISNYAIYSSDSDIYELTQIHQKYFMKAKVIK